MRPRGSKAELEGRRREALRLLRRHGLRDVARRVGASPGSVARWRDMASRDGGAALAARPDRGPPPKLGPRERERLVVLLERGPAAHGYPTELWTLRRVAELIERRFGVRYALSSVWALLGRLGWSAQTPARRARERDEAAIRRWRRVTWPKLRKRGGR